MRTSRAFAPTGRLPAPRRAQHAEMRASNLRHVKVSRDPHTSVRPILLLENPLSALATMCRGLERDMVGLDPEPLAYTSRDTFIIGLFAQVGFRKGTVEAMNLDDVFYDETKGRWRLRVPARRFKNGQVGPLRQRPRPPPPLRARSHGLARSLRRHRALPGGRPRADPRRLRDQRALRRAPHRALRGAPAAVLLVREGPHDDAFSAGWSTASAASICATTPKPAPAFRASPPFPRMPSVTSWRLGAEAGGEPSGAGRRPVDLAADAIHDGVRAVKAYVQYLPRDRQDNCWLCSSAA